mmetsp:Transcript_4105/g.12709  ORF Transcript_4105/g.12709 Transcript_4105/m.12709 type:complete len:207 (+) Transcript_4105:675-1295(+)
MRSRRGIALACRNCHLASSTPSASAAKHNGAFGAARPGHDATSLSMTESSPKRYARRSRCTRPHCSTAALDQSLKTRKSLTSLGHAFWTGLVGYHFCSASNSTWTLRLAPRKSSTARQSQQDSWHVMRHAGVASTEGQQIVAKTQKSIALRHSISSACSPRPSDAMTFVSGVVVGLDSPAASSTKFSACLRPSSAAPLAASWTRIE